MKKLILLLSCLLITASSCTNYAVSIKDNPGCKTIITGVMHYPAKWRGVAPILIIKKGGKYKLLNGKILEINEKGCIFDPAKTRRNDLDPELYEFDEIKCLIDSNMNVVHGAIPDKFTFLWHANLSLVPSDNPYADPLIVHVKPNETFSFCIDPGNYHISSILFYEPDMEGIADFPTSFPDLHINAEAGVNNYIGDIHLDSLFEDQDFITLECRKYRSKRNTTYYYVQAPGVIGGIAGALATSLINKDNLEEYEVIHTFVIEDKWKNYPGTRKSLIYIEK